MKRLFQLSLHAVTIVAIAYFCFLSYDTTREIAQLERELEKAQEVHDDHTRFLAELRDDRQKYMSAKSLVSETRQRLLQLVSSFATQEAKDYLRTALEEIETNRVVAIRQTTSRPKSISRISVSPIFWLRVPDANQKLCIRIEKISRLKQTNQTPLNAKFSANENTRRETLEERFFDLTQGRAYELALETEGGDSAKNILAPTYGLRLDGDVVVSYRPEHWQTRLLSFAGSDVSIGVPGMLNASMSSLADDLARTVTRQGCWFTVFRMTFSAQTQNAEYYEFEISLSLATSGKILVRKPEKDLFSPYIDLKWSEENNAYLVGRIDGEP